MALGLIGGALSIAGGAAKLFGLGESKMSDLPDVERAKLIKLSDYPPSPERDALIDSYSTSYKQNADLYSSKLKEIDPSISTYADTINPLMADLGGITETLKTTAGKNPYLDYWSNPAATESKYRTNLEEGINTAYGDYGSKGTAFGDALTATRNAAATKGILGSGVSRAQEAELAKKYAASKSEALTSADKSVMDYLTNIASLYNQGNQTKISALTNAANTAATAAEIAKSIPSLQMEAAKLYGTQYKTFGDATASLEKEKRNEVQEVKAYNTNQQQLIENAYNTNQMNRNIAQWNADNKNKTGWADNLINLGANVTDIGKEWGSGGGASSYGSIGSTGSSSGWGSFTPASSSNSGYGSNYGTGYGSNYNNYYGSSNQGNNYYGDTDILGMPYKQPTYSNSFF